MSTELENKIIELIDDYQKNGLHITLHSDKPDGQYWISLADPKSAPWIESMDSIASSLLGIGSSIEDASESIKTCGMGIDGGGDGICYRDAGVKVYEHPLTAIAEALFEIARSKEYEYKDCKQDIYRRSNAGDHKVGKG